MYMGPPVKCQWDVSHSDQKSVSFNVTFFFLFSDFLCHILSFLATLLSHFCHIWTVILIFWVRFPLFTCHIFIPFGHISVTFSLFLCSFYMSHFHCIWSHLCHIFTLFVTFSMYLVTFCHIFTLFVTFMSHLCHILCHIDSH